MTTVVDCACVDAAQDERLQRDRLLRPLLPAVLPWLVGRRWFSHERGCVQELRPLTTARLDTADGSAVLLHLVVEADHRDGTARSTHRYQVLVGLRATLPASLAGAAFGRAVGGRWDGWWLYEATEDPELMDLLLDRTATGRSGPTLLLSLTPGSQVVRGLPPRLLAVEQSNSAVVYGDRMLLKIFRQPQPGRHPETEVLAALTEAGSESTPRLFGWLADGEPEAVAEPGSVTVLGILEEFLDARGDGWELAVAHAVACLTEDSPAVTGLSGFTGEARSLGAAVAGVHAAMARAFPTTRLGGVEVLAQVADMQDRLQASAELVPELRQLGDHILLVYDEYAKVALGGAGLQGQRTHGDLHLGQVLRTGEGWRVIDFEGEPSRPVEERGLPQSPLRDVAGMLRSFDYAAQHALREVGEAARAQNPESVNAAWQLRHSRCAQAWAIRNRRAFADGYARAGGIDPRVHPVAMRAFELDKAVYESHYEASHRPDWLPVPMDAVRRVISRHRRPV